MSVIEQIVPDGFKHTDIGIIPKDWTFSALRDVLKESPKYGINAAAIPLQGSLPVYIRITDISEDGYFSPSEKVGVNSPFSELYKLRAGDIVLARTGASVGKSYLYRERDGELVYAGFLIKVAPKSDLLNPEFLFQYLKTERYWAWVTVNSMRSGQPGINGNEYGSLLVPLPKIKEQTAIANALSDVDALLTELEKLIAKKQAIKTATMQQLLTAKTRLPQFATYTEGEKQGQPKGTKASELGEIPEDWDVVEFGQTLKEFRNGYAFSAKGYTNTGTPIITMAQIGLSGSFQFNSAKVSKWDSKQKNLLKEFWVRNGDLLIAMTDVTPDKNLIGQMTIAKLDEVALLNQRVGLLRLKSEIASSEFFSYLSCLPVWKTYCKGVASLGVQANIGTKEIRNAKVPLPSKEEQTAIATILSDMDNEIQTLEQRLAKTRQIKQGMMQELLTGRTRLPLSMEA